MAALFNISEVIEFAVQIEQNGYEFYTQSAKKFSNEKVISLFHFLAEEELKHERVFKNLLTTVGSFSPPESYEGEYEIYRKEFLKAHSLGGRQEVQDKLELIKGENDALDFALEFEKDSIVFFTTLKKYVTEESHKKLDIIINEEVSHMTKLLAVKREI